MAEVAERHGKQYETIKKEIERATNCAKRNNQRYMKFQKMVYETGISATDEATLRAFKKPVIEFNILGAPIARLCGEFSKQEPDIYIHPSAGLDHHPAMMGVLDGHFRHILYDAQKHGVQYGAHKNQLAGGFGVFRVEVDYENPRSFKQVIKLRQEADPTLVYFDPLAEEVTKCDAKFCGKIIHMTLEDFKADYPKVDTDSIDFRRSLDNSFSWSYKTDQGNVMAVCEHYKFKDIKKTLVKLPNGMTMLKDKYNDYKTRWESEGRVSQFPVIVEERPTLLKRVCRYTVIGTQIIAYDETEFSYLPFVFIDNDSALLKDNEMSMMTQFTKPYVYPAEGVQRLMNFCGQVIANDFENMVMHRFKVAEESLPTEEAYLEAYKNIQMPATLVYKAYNDQDPNQPLPPPQEIARVPLPPEVIAIFGSSMQTLQNILGTYDASLGINDNQLSGVAIVEGATQSNAAAMPSIVNYMQAMTQVGIVIFDLIPKIFITPQTVPIVSKEGEYGFFDIPEGKPFFNYEDGDLSVRVEAGVNFAIAKNQALKQIITMMEALPAFGEFIQAKAMDVVLDNMEFRGVDIIKERYKEWQKELEENPKPSPQEMEMQIQQQKLQLEEENLKVKTQENKLKAVADIGGLLVDKQKADNDRLNSLVKMGASYEELEAAKVRAEAEEDRARADLEIALDEIQLKREDQQHRHAKDILELIKPEKETNE